MPNLIMMVGLPGSGKSTYAKTLKYPIISTDEYIETMAKDLGKTYTEIFPDYIDEATKYCNEQVQRYTAIGRSFIWDQTNLNKSTRMKKLENIDLFHDYHKIVVVVLPPSEELLMERLRSRPGKVIPDDVIKAMYARYEKPTFDEGWDEIRCYDSVTDQLYHINNETVGD